MGACAGARNKSIKVNLNQEEQNQFICKIDVAKVPRIKANEEEKFREDYICDDYVYEGEEGFDERLKDAQNLMFKRWDWLQENKEIYVNMLRLEGFSDDNIQDCLDGKRPLCFRTKDLHKYFCKDLTNLKYAIENELNIKGVRYVQSGSSVPGYSSNPLKGFADKPSKITNIEKSDVDVVIIATGIRPLIEAKKKEGLIRVKEFPSVTCRTGGGDVRFGVKNIEAFSTCIKDWEEKWGKIMGGGVQITFQEEGCSAPPWELPIKILKNS